MRKKLNQVALRTSLLYGLAGGLWILLSDGVLVFLFSDPATINRMQTYKGWAFVAVTALLLYITLRGQFRRWGEETDGRRQAEEALRQSEDRYRQLFEGESDAIFLIDNETGRIQEANGAASALYGYTREELLTKRNSDLSAEPEDTRRVTRETPVIFDEVVTIPLRFHAKKDGTVFPVEITGRFFSWQGRAVHIAAIRDITGRRQSEEALRESEAQANRLAQENAIVAEIGKIISSTLKIEEVYERFAEEARKLIPFERININLIDHETRTVISAYTAGEAIKGRQIGDVFPLAGSGAEAVMRTRSGLLFRPEDAGELQRRFPGLAPSFQAGHRSMIVIPLISKSKVIGNLYFGSTKSLAFTDQHLRLAENIGAQIAGAIANAQLFAEHQKLEERLHRAEKMEAMGTLAGGVAHDMNNVLGVLVGYSELLLMEIPEGNPLRNHVANILQSGRRGAAIIQDLLTLARRGVTVSEVVNLNKVVSDHFRTPEFEKLKAYHPQVAFNLDLDRDLMNIKGSPHQLNKTIMNLLSNAAEAISGQGEVALLTENRHLDRPVAGYDDIQEGDYVVLKVLDNGQGISQQDLGRIFEPFYTKKVMGRSGTGLGLTVVWGTVKDHHGYIDVHSRAEKGTAFALYFPVTREEATGEGERVPVESYRGRGESILVVDDVKGQRELATAMLGMLGYRVDSVPGGEEAVAYLKTNRADLLVLDMIMDPGMDGLETYRKVLEINPKQKAIIVSGFSETDRVKMALEMGAGAYVGKPYIMEKIGLAVRRELDRR
jgi:PAS domain S-box-containing protein